MIDVDLAVEQAVVWGDLCFNAPPRWTEEDDAFVRDSIGWLTDAQIGDALGRTDVAVKLRRQRDLKLPAASKQPGYLTGQGVADALGIDGHNALRLVDRGILPGRSLPGPRGIRVVNRVTLLRWAVNPLNWPYYQAWNRDIPDPHIRRLVARQLQRWGDAWLTPQQAADLHGVDHTDINRYIHAGKIKNAVQWGNWYILRSEMMRPDLAFYKGKGAARQHAANWSAGADAFIVRARAGGMSYVGIAARMRWDVKRVMYRAKLLREKARESDEQN